MLYGPEMVHGRFLSRLRFVNMENELKSVEGQEYAYLARVETAVRSPKVARAVRAVCASLCAQRALRNLGSVKYAASQGSYLPNVNPVVLTVS